MKSSCIIYSGDFYKAAALKQDSMITKDEGVLNLVYKKEHSLEAFEAQLNLISGHSSSFYRFKKRFLSLTLSFISVLVILFALISSSLYEDMLKKIIFESPFAWGVSDNISLLFVLLFFFGLLMMPSILDGESSQFKDLLRSWFNKDIRILKRLRVSIETQDKKTEVHLYNFDLQKEQEWLWRLLMKALLLHFNRLHIHVRNDQKRLIANRLKDLGCKNVTIEKHLKGVVSPKVDQLFSSKEETLFTLMQLSSTHHFDQDKTQSMVSLELFEYCGRNFLSQKSEQGELISGFQNFINRSFDDFYLLKQLSSLQIAFNDQIAFKELLDEKRRLSYYLRNHIEECVEYFDNPISLLILYYYVKDIVLDEKRVIKILEKFIASIKSKQQYDLIGLYWFDIAGKMFDASKLKEFSLHQDSIYRKLSIEALNNLMFLFERNGEFVQALLLANYLYEINPSKYAIDMCSLHERMGEFDEAFAALPQNFSSTPKSKPTDIEIRYHQRKAWIIVSQRKEALKEQGEDNIQALKRLLFSHNENNEPLWLWHYYNIKANYAEWAGEYKQAIAYYEKSLSIPALGAFEYGATFVNMAIAYRFIYIQSSFKEVSMIKESIALGQIGVDLKASVGDRDEMPVVLHNQALNVLYASLQTIDQKEIETVYELTQQGIAILDQTSSIKRLGIMLCEAIIASSLIQKSNQELIDRLESHWPMMDAYEKEQALMIYKNFCQAGHCEALNFM